jgi:two-component system, chemotaxis family, CheB/CheR fusion protein
MPSNLRIVGIGASAGGVEALEAFFKAMPDDNGLAFVVVTHLDPNRESMLAEILGRATRMPVVNAQDGEPVAAHHVYVLPAGAILTAREGRLQVRGIGTLDRERAPIDLFFASLAEDQGEHAIAIVLSGSGTDGTLGLKAIKEHGGLTLAQGSNVSRPRFAEMPSSAVTAGFVDLLLPVEEIPERIIAYVRKSGAVDMRQPGDALSNIYALLRSRTGHDFSLYKDTTFHRRVERRMHVRQAQSLMDYVERLQKEPDEVSALFRDLLIGVTDFFRDPAAYQALETLVIPKLFDGRGAADEVRVWVPGCATGEEAYSIAILLRERMDALQEVPKVQIFATDIDDAALAMARAARYLPNLVKQISPARLRRFFISETGAYRVTKELRDMCIFSSHSVIRDPPFSRIDLISCRNLLIYMKPELQTQLLPLFHYALRSSGYLFLGLSEHVSRHSDLFLTADRKNRIFRRRDLATRPALALGQIIANGGRGGAVSATAHGSPLPRLDLLRTVSNTILERFAPAFVVVNEEGETLHFSAGTGKYLQAPPGPPNRDVLAMARAGLRGDLRGALHQAKASGQRASRERVPVQSNGGVQVISLAVEPITVGNETVYGVVFADAGPLKTHDAIAAGSRAAGEDLAARQIEQELQETKERLQSTIEELETANEEFRSSNEELLSVNEELQSTNEELETSKEELQSVNEELQTVNAELNNKIEELDRSNHDLNNLLQSTQIATVFLDRNLVIRSFTPAVTKIFSLIPTDRGRPLTDIVSRVDHQDLQTDVHAVFERGEVIERAIRLVDGEDHYLLRMLPYRGRANAIEGVVITFVDVTKITAAEERQKALAAELSHRVKNSLAVVASIAERTLKPGEAKDRFLSRLHAKARAHDLLSGADWTELPLRDVIVAQLAPHPIGDKANVTISGPRVLLKPRTSLFLSMVFHELIANAAKYGALSVPDGRIDASWALEGDSPGHLRLTWLEHGGPKIARLGKRGFGSELIEKGVPFELQGDAALEVVDGGLQCKIDLPAKTDLLTLGRASSGPASG